MEKIKIVFLVLPHVHLMDLAGPDQVFLEAIGYDANFEIEYCCSENNISTSAMLPFGKLKHFSKVKITAGDYLFIPGAEVHYLQSKAFKTNRSLFKWIRHCNDEGVNLCSICSGAFVLAETGLLSNRNCTTHWKRTAELQTVISGSEGDRKCIVHPGRQHLHQRGNCFGH